jgi:hypothetical protein
LKNQTIKCTRQSLPLRSHSLLSCDSVGMGYQEPDHECSAERKTTGGPRSSDSRRTRQTTECHSRTIPYGCFSGRRKWLASRRIVGTQMGGCGFQEKCDSHSAFHCESENWAAKNRSLAKANSETWKWRKHFGSGR